MPAKNGGDPTDDKFHYSRIKGSSLARGLSFAALVSGKAWGRFANGIAVLRRRWRE
jgi:hypothetical protein